MTDKTEDQKNSEGSKLRKQLEEALAANKNLQRDLAVTKSGLDTSKPLVKLFVDNYNGDWDPEAFTAKAKEYDLIGEDDSGSSDETTETTTTTTDSESDEREVEAVSHGALFDKVFNSTNQGGSEAPPAGKKNWQKAQSAEEFLANYDGRTV